MNNIENSINQSQGLYQQMINSNRIQINPENFTKEYLQELFSGLFYNGSSERTQKIFCSEETARNFMDMYIDEFVNNTVITQEEYHYPF